MKKSLDVLILLIAAFFQSFGQPSDDKDNTKVPDDNMSLDKEYKAASTKSEVERQVFEIKDLIKQKRAEINAWDDVISDLNNALLNPDQRNFSSRWAEVDKMLASNKPDLNLVYYQVQTIAELFSPSNIVGYKQVGAISNFSRRTNRLVSDIREKMGIPYDFYQPSIGDTHTAEEIKDIVDRGKKYFTDENYKQFIAEYTKRITSQLQEAKAKQDFAKKWIDEGYKKIDELNKVIEDKDVTINQRAINIGLPLFCVTVIILFFGAYLYKRITLQAATNPPEAGGEDFISRTLLEVITVLLITMTVLILGLARILQENVLGTLLGGIAGYILNRTRTANNGTT